MELLTMSTSELTRLGAMERLQARDLTQAEVAGQLGLSVRQVKRLVRRFRRDGPAGLISTRRGRPSNRRTDPQLIEHALELVREHYADCGPTFAAEKLDERHGVRIDHETLRRAMIASGQWRPQRKRRRTIHPPRERRPCFGELVQIDGSHHPWFEERGPKCTLYVAVDDATSALLALHFAEQETTEGYFQLVRQLALEYGLPLAFYSDRHSIFRFNNEAEIAHGPTQFGRAMQELEIELICANSPQAKGRVERANGTLQQRLVKELRYRHIDAIAEGNAFLPEFIALYNAKFAKLPRTDVDAHRPAPPVKQLDRILVPMYERTVTKNLTVHFENQILHILRPEATRRLQHAKVRIRRDRAGRLSIEYRGESLPYRRGATQHLTTVLDAKTLAAQPALNPRAHHPEKVRTPPMTHPWKAQTYRVISTKGHL